MATFNTEKIKLDGGAILANNAADSNLKISTDGGATFSAVGGGGGISSTESGHIDNSINTGVASWIVGSGHISGHIDNSINTGVASWIVGSGHIDNSVNTGAASWIVGSGHIDNSVNTGAASWIKGSGHIDNSVNTGAASWIKGSGHLASFWGVVTGDMGTQQVTGDIASYNASANLENTATGYQTVTFNKTFDSNPRVVGTLETTGYGHGLYSPQGSSFSEYKAWADKHAPIIAIQVSGASTTKATFVFSDEPPNTGYYINWVATSK